MNISSITERTLFVGARIPGEIKTLAKILTKTKLEKSEFHTVLQLIVNDLEGKDVDAKLLESLQSDKLTNEILDNIYTGFYSLLLIALRLPLSSLKPDAFKEDLAELHIPEALIEDLASVVFGARRPCIDRQALNSRPRLPKLETFRWRVDVAISTSVLNRVLEPSVLMEMTLSDGKVHTFENAYLMDLSNFSHLARVGIDGSLNYLTIDFKKTIQVPVSKFHELRYNAAFVLKEMEDLEKRSILKIQD